MSICWPAWHAEFAALDAKLKSTTLSSGCATSNGNVQCPPESMRVAAAAKLAAMGLPANLSLNAYALARYMQSEVGSGSIEERVAVGEAAVNRAKLRGKSVADLLLRAQAPTHPNYDYFGPIHGGSVETAPYGRWAATSKDPSVSTALLAMLVESGRSDNFSNGADDQDGLEYFSDPEGKVRKMATTGDYWVGPLVGVNPWHTFLSRHYGNVSAADAAALLARGLDYVRARKRVGSKWAAATSPAAPVCGDDGGYPETGGGLRLTGPQIVGVMLGGSALLATTIYLGRRAAGKV